MATSGYTACGCHDCFETAVSGDMDHPELCAECAEAGCSNYTNRPGFLAGYEECQREDAYDNWDDMSFDDYPGYDPYGSE